jgi:hypothetical protein
MLFKHLIFRRIREALSNLLFESRQSIILLSAGGRCFSPVRDRVLTAKAAYMFCLKKLRKNLDTKRMMWKRLNQSFLGTPSGGFQKSSEVICPIFYTSDLLLVARVLTGSHGSVLASFGCWSCCARFPAFPSSFRIPNSGCVGFYWSFVCRSLVCYGICLFPSGKKITRFYFPVTNSCNPP